MKLPSVNGKAGSMFWEVIFIAEDGRMVGGKYYLIKVVGRGGFGEVYLAVDIHIGKQWAVKRLLNQNEDGIREALVMKELDYPTLPRIVDLIRERNEVYLVMDFLEGESVGKMLREGKKFSKDEILKIGSHLAQTLEYLHKKQPAVLYCDLKPENILLTKEGQIKLIDFGIAAHGKVELEKHSLRGTKGYAAPEQYGGVCDNRTDIYGLGMTLKALVGKRKMAGLGHIIRRCTRHKKENRYQSASEVKKRLEYLCENRHQNHTISSLALTALGILLAAGVLFGIFAEAEKRQYYKLLQEASQPKTKAEEAAELYKKACELHPEKEEAYLRFLELCQSNGRTLEATDWLESMWEIYPEETAKHWKVREQMAILYLCGNALDEQFPTDCLRASQIFGQMSREEESWKTAAELSAIQEKFAVEIDWEEFLRKVEILKSYGERMERQKKEASAFEWYRICGSVFLVNAAYLGESAYEEGISCYEKAADLVEAAKIEQGRRLDLWERLSAAYYMKALKAEENRNVSAEVDLRLNKEWERSIHYGQKVMSTCTDEKCRQRIMLREASIYKIQRNSAAAKQSYEKYLHEFPKEIEGICAYAEFLMENQETAEAKRVLEEAEESADCKTSRNYQILKERLEDFE